MKIKNWNYGLYSILVLFVKVEDDIGDKYILLILFTSAITKDLGFSLEILSTNPSSSAILKNALVSELYIVVCKSNIPIISLIGTTTFSPKCKNIRIPPLI
jgi:hypothetical protein